MIAADVSISVFSARNKKGPTRPQCFEEGELLLAGKKTKFLQLLAMAPSSSTSFFLLVRPVIVF